MKDSIPFYGYLATFSSVFNSIIVKVSSVFKYLVNVK